MLKKAASIYEEAAKFLELEYRREIRNSVIEMLRKTRVKRWESDHQYIIRWIMTFSAGNDLRLFMLVDKEDD